jgi:hypothetical protein
MNEDIIIDIVHTSPENTIITDVSCSIAVRKKRATNTIKPPKNTKLTCDEYHKNPTDLTKYKIPELKALAKLYKLHITGNKQVLIHRIQNYFQSSISVIVIQKNLRRFFVKRSFQLRGPAIHDRSLCTNPTDFYTLEPLDEIPHQAFFSYTEIGANGQYTYGFNIQSLMHLLRRKGRAIINPYNRGNIPEKAIGDLIRLYLYTITLFPDHVCEEELHLNSRNQFLQPANPSAIAHGVYYGFPRHITPSNGYHMPLSTLITRRPNDSVSESVQISTIFEASQNIPTVDFRALRNHVIPRTHSLSPAPVQTNRIIHDVPVAVTEGSFTHTDIAIHMQEIRSKPIETRIQELFMEIDQLGNYTQVSWFTNLTKRELYSYYHRLNNIWRYRSRIIFSVRHRICPLGDPFQIAILNIRLDEISIDQLVMNVITTMENLCYTAMDIEDRKLGAIYTLIALTHVSLPARENLTWLYESM